MNIKEGETTSVTKKDFYYCNRCNVSTNTEDQRVPCPRGGCEAEIVGVITITEIKLIELK